MAFRLSKDAKVWFKHIRDDLDYDWDEYYFCLMAGLVMNKKIELDDKSTTELLDKFPDKYIPNRAPVILASYLSTVIEQSQGVDLANRKNVEQLVKQRISPDSAHRLTAMGMKEMNSYSNGGFEILRQWFDDPPRVLGKFLPRFLDHIKKAKQ